MIEILAPAGDESTAVAAIQSGANAVYLGLTSFSARSSAVNLDTEALRRVIAFAHLYRAKVYVAMNTLVKESQMEEYLQTLVAVHNLGADAIIMQDIFLGKYVHETYPQINLHLSTQAGTCNIYGAKLAKEYGFSRVILARETPLKDVKEIASFMETEVFVQGALCTCFSGQCYLSSFIGGNSGNRGACKQPCRKKYAYSRKGFDSPAYRLSLADLSVGEGMQELAQAGVQSLKIEGRMRRTEYVIAAVRYYRAILDGADGKEIESRLHDLKRMYNRGNYTKGLTFGQKKDLISDKIQGHIGERVGSLKVIKGKYVCECQERFTQGDAFKIVRNGVEVGNGIFGESLPNGFILKSNDKLSVGDAVYITTDINLQSKLFSCQNQIDVEVSLFFRLGEKPQAYAKLYETEIVVEGEVALQTAQTSPLTEAELKSNFNKTDRYPFSVHYREVVLDGAVFLAKSELNSIRRLLYTKLYNSITENKTEPILYVPYENYIREQLEKLKQKEPKNEPTNRNLVLISNVQVIQNLYYDTHNNIKSGNLSVMDNNMSDIQNYEFVFKPTNYMDFSESDAYLRSIDTINQLYYDRHIKYDRHKKIIYLPGFMTSAEISAIQGYLENFDAIYTDGLYGIEVAKMVNKLCILGNNINIFNLTAIFENADSIVTASKELTFLESLALSQASRTPLYYLSYGSLKVMDLIYCPFSVTCSACDKKPCYTLTDEGGRAFPVRRYKVGNSPCRFELFNYADIVARQAELPLLVDLSCIPLEKQALLLHAIAKGTDVKEILPVYTAGHFKKGVI